MVVRGAETKVKELTKESRAWREQRSMIGNPPRKRWVCPGIPPARGITEKECFQSGVSSGFANPSHKKTAPRNPPAPGDDRKECFSIRGSLVPLPIRPIKRRPPGIPRHRGMTGKNAFRFAGL